MVSVSTAVVAMALCQVQEFTGLGYAVPCFGVWYPAGTASSAMPLGSLGTGFVDITSAGTFGDSTAENNWLKPRPVPAGCGFSLLIGGHQAGLFPNMKPTPGLRFWGHYPAADMEFGNTFGEIEVYARAYAPLIPHDYDWSGVPVAFFRFVMMNRGQSPVAAEIAFQWEASQTEETHKAGAAIETIPDGRQWKGANGSYAVAASGAGWEIAPENPGANTIRVKTVRTLEAGEKTEVVFALAWHFPTWTSSDGEELRHRYADAFPDAAGVMHAALPRAADIEKRIIAWQQPIYISPVPGLLKDAIINGLYILPRNSWWTSDGRFFQSESFTGCPITETFVCRFYGSFPLAALFPECEKATMRSVAAAQKPDGEIPFGFGTPAGSRSPYYHVQHPIVSPEFALVTWRNASLWNDMAYLREMYPKVQAALRFAMTLDKDGDGVVNEDPGSETGFPANQYYDVWPWWGTSAYTGGIWLAALRAGEEMAKRMEDPAFAAEMRGWYDRALKSYNDKLWTGSYYRLYNDPEGKRVSATSLTNALCGQWFAYASGLGEILPKACIRDHIEAVLRWNVAATPYGAVNGVRPDGTVDETFPDHSAVITIGEVWNFCTMAVHAGRVREALQVFSASYGNILLSQRTPWNIPWSLDRRTGAIKWGINYYSNPCVWTLLHALDPATCQRLSKNELTLGVPAATAF